MPDSVEKRFVDLKKILESSQFRGKEGIINEVPFFISPYPPSQETETQKQCKHLFASLSNQGIEILEVNLFDLCVEIMKARGRWDQLIAKEPEWKKDLLKGQIQNLTDVDQKIIPAISEKLAAKPNLEILFITGVGLVYPFMRSHNLLNNLQRIAKDYPTLMFFPGEYTFTEGRGQSLDLFGILNEDKYYRAFNIEEYKLSS